MIKPISIVTGWMRRLSLYYISVTFLLLFVGFLTVYPLTMIIYTSFNTGAPGAAGHFTLSGYIEDLNSPDTFNVFLTSIWLAAARTAISIAITVFLAWVVARTDTPYRNALRFLIEFRFFMPYMPFIIAWILLLSPKSGIINVFLANIFGLKAPLFNVFSYAGIIWVSIFAGVPVYFLLILPAFLNMDASLEESSKMSGAGNFTTFFRVTLPLVMPAILGATMLSFIHNMETFDVEALLGMPVGIFVFSTKIFAYINYSLPSQYTPAMALSVLLIVFITILIILQWLFISSRQYKYITVTGRGYAVRPGKLGRWKYITFSLVLLYFVVSTLVPGFFVILGTFMKVSGIFVGDWFTLKHWQLVLNSPKILGYFWNSLLLGVGSATLGVLLYSLISYVLIKTKFVGRPLLEFFSWIPYLTPGIVLALGLLWVYVGGLPLPFVLYGTIWLLIICCVTKRLPIGVRALNGVMVQIGNELEEASRVHGATWWYTFRRIMLPLLRPGLINAWLLVFIFSVKELIVVLMLFTPKSKTLSVEIFERAIEGGQAESALIVGILEVFLCIFFWLATRWVARWTGGKKASHSMNI